MSERERDPHGGRNLPLPWTGKPRRADVACWAGISLSGFYYLALTPLRPELVGAHPVLLELLTGGMEGIVAAAAFARTGSGSVALALLAAVPGLMKFNPLYWWAGRLWGQRAIDLLAGRRRRWARLAGRVRQTRHLSWAAVVLSPFLPVPALFYVIAGWAGMRLATFLLLDLIGTLLWAGALVGLGFALGRSAVDVAVAISHYGLWISLALIAAIIASQVLRARRARSTGDEAGGEPGGGAPERPPQTHAEESHAAPEPAGPGAPSPAAANAAELPPPPNEPEPPTPPPPAGTRPAAPS